MTTQEQLALKDKPVIQVTCHAFNKTGDMVALSPNSSEVYIYRTNNSEENEKWELKWILSEVRLRARCDARA